MPFSDSITQGGQTFLHKLRMVKQVSRLAFTISFCIALITFFLFAYLKMSTPTWKISKNYVSAHFKVLVYGDKLQFGIPKIFYLVFTISSLSIPILLTLVILFLKKWNSCNLVGRIYNSLFILLSFGYCWQLYYWNLLGYHF